MFIFKGTEGVNGELGSGPAGSQEDKFKVPDGKLLIKAETAEPEKSKVSFEDQIETDGVVTKPTTKSEADNVPQVRICKFANNFHPIV